jgi:hypothetical protein
MEKAIADLKENLGKIEATKDSQENPHFWTLYPCHVKGRTLFARPYCQVGTITGDWEKLKAAIPPSLRLTAPNVFELVEPPLTKDGKESKKAPK